MTTLFRYKLLCNVHGIVETDYRTSSPTVCPINAADSIDNTQIFIIDQFTQTARIETLEDNRLTVAPAVIPEYMTQYHTGCGDDFSGGKIADGDEFYLANDGSGCVIKSTYFVTPVVILGGDIVGANAGPHDWVTLAIIAPANTVTADPSGLGNCNLINVGFGHIIVPALGNGAYNIDLNSGINSNLDSTDPFFVSKAVPVPALDVTGTIGVGYWDWHDVSGLITPSAPGQGRYNLFDVSLNLATYVNRYRLWSPTGYYYHSFDLVQKGRLILPHWQWKAILYRDGSHAVDDLPLQITWNIRSGRRRTCQLLGPLYV